VLSFMQATVDLRTASQGLKAAAKVACAKMATDLGAPDTWTGADPFRRRPSM
jgi:hypothetical protein